LNVVRITVPPLRERRADIPELIDFFIDKVNRTLGTSIVGITDDARDVLVRHSWPGNVRELENTLLRAAVLARGRTLLPEDFTLLGTKSAGDGGTLGLDDAVRRLVWELLETQGTSGTLYDTVLAAIERPLIALVLERVGGNQVKAADVLGINRNTLRKKITDLGIAVRKASGGAV
jgi:two-component system nitrogen regulation response regulator GlnG